MISTFGRRMGVITKLRSTDEVVEKDDQPRKESKDMSLSSVVSVECVKLKKKSRTNKVLYFRLAVIYDNEERRYIDRPYIALFDFQKKIEGLLHRSPSLGEDVQVPELRRIQWFEKHFIQVSKDDKRKAIEEFFQRLLALPGFISKSRDVTEFFEFHWSPSCENRTPKTSLTSDTDSGVSRSNSGGTLFTEAPLVLTNVPIDTYEEVTIPEIAEYDQLNLKKAKAFIVREDTRPEGVEQTYIAINSYTQRKSGEVNLVEGNVVHVMQGELSGWWFVHVEDSNEQGWAPASCLLPTNRNSYTEQTRPVIGGQLEKLQTTRDYEARCPDELSYKAGEPVEVLEAFMDGWWKVRCRGEVGLMPATYLEPVSKGSPKNSVYHMNVYRKNTPPPRRKSDESVDDLYARVEEIQSRKRMQQGAAKPKFAVAQFKEDDVQGYAEIDEPLFDIEPYEELPMSIDCNKPPSMTGSSVKGGGGGAVGVAGFTALVNSGVQKYVNIGVNIGVEPAAAATATKPHSSSVSEPDTAPPDVSKLLKPLPPVPSDEKSIRDAQNVVTVMQKSKVPLMTTRQLTTEKPNLPSSPKIIVNAKVGGSLSHCRNNSSPVLSEGYSNSSVAPSSPAYRISPPVKAPQIHPLTSAVSQSSKVPSSASPQPPQSPGETLHCHTGQMSSGPRPDVVPAPTPLKQVWNQKPTPVQSKSGSSLITPSGVKVLPAVPVRKVNGLGSIDDGVQIEKESMPGMLKKPVPPMAKPTAPDKKTKPTANTPAIPAKPSTQTSSPKSSLTSMSPPSFPPPMRDSGASSLPTAVARKPGTPASGSASPGWMSKSAAFGETVEDFKSVLPKSSAAAGRVQPLVAAKDIPAGDYEAMFQTKFSISRLDRVSCETILLQSRQPRQFVLRDSLTKPGHFALSVYFDNRIHHFPIELTSSNKFFIGHYNFDTLDHVIDYYRKNALFHSDDNVGILLGNILVT